jgi:hypothetical protein
VQRRRTAGMTALAVLNILFGALGILSGLLRVLQSLALMYQLWLLDVLGFFAARPALALLALLIVATGVIGVVAGVRIFALRPSARASSLAYAGLLALSSVLCFIAALMTYPLAVDATTLTLFVATYLAIPLPYALVLFLAFRRPAWKAAFAGGWVG